ncbi:unnamed protein product, partial [Symbiodinium pilosum]
LCRSVHGSANCGLGALHFNGFSADLPYSSSDDQVCAILWRWPVAAVCCFPVL